MIAVCDICYRLNEYKLAGLQSDSEADVELAFVIRNVGDGGEVGAHLVLELCKVHHEAVAELLGS